MNKHLLELERLVSRMQMRYGERDPDVQRIREELNALHTEESSGLGPLRYRNRPMDEDRSNRVTPDL